jgi:hypothetical protein
MEQLIYEYLYEQISYRDVKSVCSLKYNKTWRWNDFANLFHCSMTKYEYLREKQNHCTSQKKAISWNKHTNINKNERLEIKIK